MTDWFVQLLVLALVLLTAGIKSLRFAPSQLTPFELERRAGQSDADALREVALRQGKPLLHALQNLLALLLSIVIIIILANTYNFFSAIAYAVGWLLVVELLTPRQWLRNQAERTADRYLPQILKVAHAARPVLQPLADRQLLVNAPATFYSKEELLQEIDGDKTILSKDEKTLLRQALTYKDVHIKDIMTPRSMVVVVEKADTIGPVLLDRLYKAGHSRYPVVNKDLEHIVGVLYMHNLVPLDPKAKVIGDVMSSKVYYVHQDKPLDHALQAFLRTKHHLFIVVNEFEETTGVISIEDILETLIGRKIVDEFDQYEDLRAVARLAAAKRQKSDHSGHI